MLTRLQALRGPLNLPRVAQSLDYTCGAACFDSMFHFYRGFSLGELRFAHELQTMALGYTPPMNIVNLARDYGFFSEMREDAQVEDFVDGLSKNEVIFVTWWDGEAGHYSLVKHLEKNHITLMDPWLAREGLDNRLLIADFIPNWVARGSRMIRAANVDACSAKVSE